MAPAGIRTSRVLVTALAVAGVAWGGETVIVDPFEPCEGLTSLVEASRSDPRGRYTPASEEQRAQARALARDVVAAARSNDPAELPAWKQAASALGFELRAVGADGQPHILLCDAAGDGRGLTIVRFGEGGRQVVLQSPHSFYDIGTGQLAAELMADSNIRVLMVNNRHRHAVTTESGRHPPSDLAHQTDSWFHALTLGALDAMDQPLLVQLHGFDRRTVNDTTVDVVASCGMSSCPLVLAAIVAALADGVPDMGVARYPADISVLGGTTNVQGRALAGRPEAGFLHLELSPEARKALLDFEETRVALGTALDQAASALSNP